jgi:transposase
MEKLITYIGLDVHKNTIAVAVTESGLRKEVRDYGMITDDIILDIPNLRM